MEKFLIDKNMLKPLEDQLRCRICSEFYNNCVMAVCSHNFCSACIKQRLTTEDDCPSCFEIIRESDLRSNKLLDKLVRFYKKIQRERNSSDSEAHNQLRINTRNACGDSEIQTISVQSSVQGTVNSPSSAASRSSPLIHSLQSGLADLTYPVKLEVVECNESDMNDVVMSTNSAEDSNDVSTELEQLLQQHKTILNSLTELNKAVKRIESKIESLLPSSEGHIETRYSNQSDSDEVYNLISQLPVGLDNFAELNKMIAENSLFRDKLRKILLTSGGKDYKSFTSNVLKRLISDEVADSYSLTGRGLSSPKLVFERTEVYKFVLDVCYHSFSDSKENQLREAIAVWLVNSKTRIMRSQQKKGNNLSKTIEWNESYGNSSMSGD